MNYDKCSIGLQVRCTITGVTGIIVDIQENHRAVKVQWDEDVTEDDDYPWLSYGAFENEGWWFDDDDDSEEGAICNLECSQFTSRYIQLTNAHNKHYSKMKYMCLSYTQIDQSIYTTDPATGDEIYLGESYEFREVE